MSADTDLQAEITRIDAQRSRLGLVAVVCALIAVTMAALGLAGAGATRFVAFALLGVGGLCIVARLRLAWRRVGHARELARKDIR